MKRLLMFVVLFVVLCPGLFAYTVTLAWDRSSDNGSIIISGYNVYRSSTSGGPYTKLNVMLIPQVPITDVPMYVDPTPTGTITYYYTVTAVSAGGVESAKSNEVAANPPPAPPTNLRVVSFTAANLNIDGQKVASGPPFPVVYVLPRQTPPRPVPITVTIQ